MSRLDCGRLCEAHTGELRSAVSTRGDTRGLKRMGLFNPRHALRGDHAFMGRLVGQPRRASDVADCIDARRARLTKRVGHDMPALDLDAGHVQPKILNVAHNADRQNHAIDFKLL